MKLDVQNFRSPLFWQEYEDIDPKILVKIYSTIRYSAEAGVGAKTLWKVAAGDRIQ
jgi:hypothetical protein